MRRGSFPGLPPLHPFHRAAAQFDPSQETAPVRAVVQVVLRNIFDLHSSGDLWVSNKVSNDLLVQLVAFSFCLDLLSAF